MLLRPDSPPNVERLPRTELLSLLGKFEQWGAETRQALAETHQALVEERETCASLRQTVARRDQTIAETHQALVEERGTSASLRQTVASLRQTVAKHELSMAETHQALVKERETSTSLRQTVAGHQEALAKERQKVTQQREEIARLKGLPKRPRIKPSGMEKSGTSGRKRRKKRATRGPTKAKLTVDKVETIVVDRPPGAIANGFEEYIVQELIVRKSVILYRLQRWRLPDGKVVIAPKPDGVDSHFGPEVHRTILALYHKGQSTSPRVLDFLRMAGLVISKRQVIRILNQGNDDFIREANEVLLAGLANASWITTDDTGARHQGKNGYTTQIGNAHFTWFCTTKTKSRINFLSLLRAGHADYVVNDEALSYMRNHKLANYMVDRLASHTDRHFPDADAWNAHLRKLGIISPGVSAKLGDVATEGAIWGSVRHHGLLGDSVIVSDDAGQFNVGNHALCWVHAERLVHKLEAFTDAWRKDKERARKRIWHIYHQLKAYKLNPTDKRKRELENWFDRIFTQQTGFPALDETLARLHKNKAELLKVLDHPEIPLHTNGSENDIRCQVTRRGVSGGTRSDEGCASRDAFLSLAKTCMKLGISFWDYLGARLKVPGAPDVPWLPALVRQRCQSG